jgi:lipid II:glycine glycyltransferase (peptidoglycan interpeptide bridge formation enzyme)
MELIEIKDKNEWEGFLEQVIDKTFLQSWSWGEFQKAQGSKVWRLALKHDSEIKAIALVSKIKAKRGVYLLIQHGPLIIETGAEEKEEILKIFLTELAQLGKQEGAVFIRLNPLWKRTDQHIAAFKRMGLRDAAMHANAYDATWKLNISLNEEELLKNMRKTTRYLIRQTEKNPDIQIEITDDSEQLAIYQELNRSVASRQQFIPFSDNFIKNEFEVFKKHDQVRLIFGKYKGELEAKVRLLQK